MRKLTTKTKRRLSRHGAARGSEIICPYCGKPDGAYLYDVPMYDRWNNTESQRMHRKYGCKSCDKMWTERISPNSESSHTLRSDNVLVRVQLELNPIFDKLNELRVKCEAGGEGRIAWEITQSIRALDETRTLMKLYQAGTPLPTLASFKGIFADTGKRANDMLACPHGCSDDIVYEKYGTVGTHAECPQCGMRGPWSENKRAALQAWNSLPR